MSIGFERTETFDEVVADVFAGSGITLLAARALGHPFYGFDINIMLEFVDLARHRLAMDCDGTVLAGRAVP